MEEKTTYKKNKANIWLKAGFFTIAAVAVIEAGVIFKMANANKVGDLGSNDAVVDNTVDIHVSDNLNQPGNKTDESVAGDSWGDDVALVINTVKTPVVDLVYGFEAVDCLKVSVNDVEPYDVTFLADLGVVENIEILKFYFGEEGNGSSIGIVNGNDGQTVKVRVEQMKFDALSDLDADEKSRLVYVQEELLDTIVSNLDIVEFVSEDTKLAEENLLVETAYGKLPFSKEWEEYLVTEVAEGDPYRVVFSCQFDGEAPVELFTYSFGEGVEDIDGYLNDVPVGFAPAEAKAGDNWSAERVDVFYMMREEMDNIFNYLIRTGEFVIKQ